MDEATEEELSLADNEGTAEELVALGEADELTTDEVEVSAEEDNADELLALDELDTLSLEDDVLVELGIGEFTAATKGVAA